MNLKQSDKLIAIIGVIILVVAGIAIIFYTSAEKNNEEVFTNTEKKSFDVIWEKKTGTGKIDETASKTYDDTITISSNDHSIITNVNFNLIWEDDNTWGIMKNGKDTLKVEIKPEEGSSKEDQSTGSGNMSFDFSVSTVERQGYVEAKDEDSAEDMLLNQIKGDNEASFDITVTVKTGEKFKLLQPIRSLLHLLIFKDKGNDFEIKYTYTYYTFKIEQPEEDNSDDDKTTDIGSGSNGAIGNFYMNLAYGRSFI